MEQQKQLSVGQWFWTIFLLGIPLVNIILLLVWGFGSPSPRKNFALAVLLFELIGVIIAVVVVIFMVSVAGYSLS
ncbi:hypothetical protein [Lederbergia galactosidilytica]|nr:hypothetical protein [Lederbergia galactosidilytica]MBP1913990.1 Na+/phosphate symporter [Lederbergia galactosidilytica]